MPIESKQISENPLIVWFREDLRVHDNPALFKASQGSAPILVIYILDEASSGIRAYGEAKKWFLYQALIALQKSLAAVGADLQVFQGAADQVLAKLIDETSACGVYWNRRYGKGEIELDTTIKANLDNRGIEAKSFASSLLHEPAKLQTGAGGPYRVYTPFWRAFSRTEDTRLPLPAPEHLNAWQTRSENSLSIEQLKLLPTTPDWSSGLRKFWNVSENGADKSLSEFLTGPVSTYTDDRNIPRIKGTSRLSPHLSLGTISPYQVWHKTKEHVGKANPTGLETFRKEVVWREFSYHLLYHFPNLGTENFNAKFDNFPWLENDGHLTAWQKGQTGYPIVDAGMRELWQTGWMHNRVRMIVGSFLVKHLLLHWRHGEEWFWNTLCDADRASNTASWQWIAGSGADAAPYFRVFNPILQGEKFDPDGSYVSKFVPEISRLPPRFIHKPWEASAETLRGANVCLGDSYPKPVVDHAFARKRALEAYEQMKVTVQI